MPCHCPRLVATCKRRNGDVSDPLLRPACGRRIASPIRGAKLELIRGMGHDLAPGLAPRWAELIGSNAGRS
jgi:hypothetical protein